MTKKTSSEQSSDNILHAVRGEFYDSIAEVLRAARSNAYRAVNFVMVEAYWNIGRMIVEEEQQGKGARRVWGRVDQESLPPLD